MSTPDLFKYMHGPGYPGPGFTGVPTVTQVNVYTKHHFGDIWRSNGVSSPFKPAYPVIHTKHARKTLDAAADAHDPGYYILTLPGSPFEGVSRKNWDIMYRNYIKAERHAFIAMYQYRVLRAFGGRAWKGNAREMLDLGYVDLVTWAEIKRSELTKMPILGIA